MDRPQVVLDLGDAALARDLAAGGLFVAGCTLELGVECDLLVRARGDELVVAARVVFVNESGAGLELAERVAELKEQLAALIARAPADEVVTSTYNDEADDATVAKRAPNLHDRLRGLTLVQQIKKAQHGEMSERVVLERIYGKTVWEPLLRNPRVTGPEVARIARMGALPRPMIELIVTNGAWLQIPEIRRSLLSNPRLGTDQILRVLRMLPKHELKLAAGTTGYPHPVRDAAKRLIRELG
ncbi:MAG TPA: hypothetical protein VGG74_35750 [Kofleriaceae bacterium]